MGPKARRRAVGGLGGQSRDLDLAGSMGHLTLINTRPQVLELLQLAEVGQIAAVVRDGGLELLLQALQNGGVRQDVVHAGGHGPHNSAHAGADDVDVLEDDPLGLPHVRRYFGVGQLVDQGPVRAVVESVLVSRVDDLVDLRLDRGPPLEVGPHGRPSPDYQGLRHEAEHLHQPREVRVPVRGTQRALERHGERVGEVRGGEEMRWLAEDDLPDHVGGDGGEHVADVDRDVLACELGAQAGREPVGDGPDRALLRREVVEHLCAGEKWGHGLTPGAVEVAKGAEGDDAGEGAGGGQEGQLVDHVGGVEQDLVEGRVVDVDLLGGDADDGPVLLVHALDLERELAALDDAIVRLVPLGCRAQSGAGILGERVPKEAVEDQSHGADCQEE